MSVYIYNTLARKKEELIPLNPQKVNLYTCGVTVYDESHIGHARSLYIFDVIRRYLKYRGFKVNFVRNITDIDDKIIKRAQELKVDWRQLVAKYIDRYYEDLRDLGIEKADAEPRATENIPEMIAFIQGLIDKGYAYNTVSGVYFNVRKFTDYGKLSGQSIDQMKSGVRIEPDEEKKDPLDFALWKKSKEDEPFWESPLGRGRPGWHIECSVMSQKFLKTDTLDIHAGGRDLVFPHHENEIAQAEALSGKPFAKYWLHHGLLTINGQKMAKSLGNFVTIKNFIERYGDTDILKLFFLSAHYANPIDYTEEKIEEARKQRQSFDAFFDKVNNWIPAPAASSADDLSRIEKISENFQKSMDDDFNMPQAVASLFELIDAGSEFVSQDKEKAFQLAKSKLETFFNVFGLRVKTKTTPPEVLKMSSERAKAREKGDFKKADELRNLVRENYNYAILDTKSSLTVIEIKP